MTLAREDGRRLGFESGYRRAQEERDMASGRAPALTDRYEDADPRDMDPQQYQQHMYQDDGTLLDADADLSPSTLRLLTLPSNQAQSPYATDIRDVPLPVPVPHQTPDPVPDPSPAAAPPQTLQMPTPVVMPEASPFLPPAQPASVVNSYRERNSPLQGNRSIRSRTPSVHLFPIDIPPPDELNYRNYNIDQPPVLRQEPPRPQPLVQRPPDNYIPAQNSAGAIPLPPPHELLTPPVRSDVSSQDFASLQAQRKDSWYENLPDQSEAQTQSWYRPRPSSQKSLSRSITNPTASNVKPKSTTSRHVRNSSFGSGSASTHISQFPLVSKSGGSVKDLGNTGKGKGLERELSVIAEGSSRQSTPAFPGPYGGENFTAGSQSRRTLSAASPSSVAPPLPPKDPPREVLRDRKREDGSLELQRAREKDRQDRERILVLQEQREKQKMADELRYSDPEEVETWRREDASRVSL